MPKLILNTIVKNESHCIIGMLEAAAQITDIIVIADTGSTDGTQDLIRKFGEERGIPTYVFDRPFDNFENSRNFGMEKAREVVRELNLDPKDCWTWWCDADEKIVVDSKFNKNQFTNDLYMINTFINTMKYTRNTFARVSKPFRFYGPIHEFIICDDTLKAMIHRQDNPQTMELYVRQSTPSIRQDGWMQVLAGHTSMNELLRVTSDY